MNQEFDLAVSEIRNEPIADSVVEAAAARVWARLAAANEANPHISGCESYQALIPDLRANRLDPARATLLRDHLHECVACRKVAQASSPALLIPGTRPQTIRRFPYRFAAAGWYSNNRLLTIATGRPGITTVS